MNYRIASIVVVGSLLISTASLAEDKPKEVIVCATQQIHACALHEGCSQLKPQETNAPDFMKIDLKNMELTGRRYDGTYGTVKIEKKTRLPKLLVLQGVNSESEELEDGLAFSVAIHVDTGRMAGSVTTTETVYSLLGTCHAL